MDARGAFLILGGSGGIGGSVARQLAASGADIALAARNEERLHALAEELGGVMTEALDACNFSAVEGFAGKVAKEHGTLRGIINCVGSVLIKGAHQTSEDEWRATLAANLDSAFAAVRAGARVMAGNGGSIVLMSSAAATVGLPNHEAVAAAKAGVAGLTRSAAATYASKGIRVNAVAPGLVETPLTAKLTASEMMRRASIALHPLGRIGRPEEVASLIVWLVSEQASWVTGQVIGIDGGLASLRGRANA